MSHLLVLGAASDIAKAVAREYAANGFHLCLAARAEEREEVEADAEDYRVRYQVEVTVLDFDALDYGSHQALYEKLDPKPAGVACFVGLLGDQQNSQTDFDHAQLIINTNYVGCASFLNVVANDFEARKNGFIIGVSSVAGDRGRMSNYTYGSAKAGFTAYLAGLRHRLSKVVVHVMTVKPGFVNTRMTEGMDLNPKLTAQPSEVAKDIIKAQQKGVNTLYTKWMWRYIMLIITNLPEFIFKRTNL